MRLSTIRLVRRTGRGLDVRGAGSIAQAIREARTTLAGVIVDVGLPDGDGLSLLPILRRGSPRVAVLVVTGKDDAWTTNQSMLCDARIARKPDTARSIRFFVEQVVRDLARGRAGASLRARAVEVLATTARLSPQGRRIVELLANDVRREQLARALGVEETTIRSHIRDVLGRTGLDRADRLAWRLLQIVDDLHGQAHPQG